MDEKKQTLKIDESILNLMDADIMPEHESDKPAGGNSSLPAITSKCFIDRELSWLQFNRRVLMQATDRSIPVLERLNFYSIYQNNLDEFFMVRVGSLIHRAILLPDYTDPKTGWTTNVQLKMIAREVTQQQFALDPVYRLLIQNLKSANIELIDFRHISKVDESMTHKLFTEMRQLLSPRIVDAEHPMPFLDNRECYTAALLRKSDKFVLGLVDYTRLPPFRSYELNGSQKIVLTEELIKHFAPQIFKKYLVKNVCTIRATRNADVFIDENTLTQDADFRESMEKLIRKRKRQQIVRLQISGKPDPNLLEQLEKFLKIPEKQIYISPYPFHMDFGKILSGAPELRYPERHPERTVKLRKGDYFRYLDQHDILLSYPYQSMMPFIEMLYEAADDPEVVSIRITLYRLAVNSKVAAALSYAADQGKDVLCLLELRARFDEKNNIDYSEMLESAGCSIIYGLPVQKVHSKLCLITRKCGDEVKYITQIGTGNYNESTAEQYCDLSLITSKQEIGEDAASFFEALALGQLPPKTEHLITAPQCFRPLLLSLLDQEIAKGKAGFVSIKINSMNDMEIMKKLIECSRAEVSVDLYIRGICCLRPGLKDFTENIRVRSVVGRYLEHSRVYVFGRDGDRRIFIGSGDLLNRNTRRRVETFVEITSPDIQEQVMEVMDAFRHDDVKGWIMMSDGSYRKASEQKGSDSQERLARYFSTRTVKPLPNSASAETPETEEKKHGWFYRLFHG